MFFNPKAALAEIQKQNKHPKITEHMSQYINARRAQLGLSLNDLAARTDMSKTHVWEIEKGRAKNPTLWIILALCDGLQCSLNDLIGRDVSQPLFTASEMALIDAHRRIFAA